MNLPDRLLSDIEGFRVSAVDQARAEVKCDCHENQLYGAPVY
jgi:hypothetical protein